MQYIQQKVREIKLLNLIIKHRTIIALVSKKYRKEYNTIKKITKNKKSKKQRDNNTKILN